MVSSTGTFVSCKDYDDDIDNINKELSTLKGDLSALQAKVNEGKWITSLAPTTGGFTVTFSDNTSYTITNGKDGAAGADAVKWEIGTDGFWYKNDVKTEYQAVGQAGEAGVAGVSLISVKTVTGLLITPRQKKWKIQVSLLPEPVPTW